MSTIVMALVAIGLTVLFSTIAIARLLKSSAGPKPAIVRGAIFQSALFGVALGFLLIPHAPPPPPAGKDLIWFFAGIVAIEIIRLGLYLRLPFAPRSALHYRLAAMRKKQAVLERTVRQLEELAALRG